MLKFLFNIFALVGFFSWISPCSSETVLFNFNVDAEVSAWVEQSDTLRTTGRSKATIVINENGDYRNAVLFTLLNPISDSGFAQMRVIQTFNLSDYSNLVIQCRGQGEYSGFKVVLRHQGLNSGLNSTYEQFFTAPDSFSTVTLPLDDFKPYFRGVEVTGGEALEKSDITVFGLEFYAGYYENVTQSGPATLEIDWVKATS